MVSVVKETEEVIREEPTKYNISLSPEEATMLFRLVGDRAYSRVNATEESKFFKELMDQLR